MNWDPVFQLSSLTSESSVRLSDSWFKQRSRKLFHESSTSSEGSSGNQMSSDGQKMVLQLVLPQTGAENIKQEPPITPDYIRYDLFKPRKGYQNTHAHFFPNAQQSDCLGRGLRHSSSDMCIPDASELTVTSLEGSVCNLDRADPPPTPPEEKIKMFRGYLTVILSCVYAVFIVTLGVVIYVSDVALRNGTPLAETFSIYLVVFGLAYFAFLYADIRRYLRKVKSRNSILLNKDDGSIKDSGVAFQSFSGENPHLVIPLPSKLAEGPLPHQYCLSKGRHSGSFYLKVGAAGFCFGHLIHSGLMLGYQIVYLRAEGEEFYNCASIATLLLDVLYPVYSFLQLFFIFKYSNVIINRCKELARFALMHCIASSLCFWIWTILRETLDSLNSYAKYDDNADDDDRSEEGDLFENPVDHEQHVGDGVVGGRIIYRVSQNWCKKPDPMLEPDFVVGQRSLPAASCSFHHCQPIFTLSVPIHDRIQHSCG
ncbi:uncharacterized protein LOC110839581 [Zootermopsis nevadensis]|uniref:uncharacterized protein LOC110839581 n=1 Tax=Zootermopsis nevadensis TaxID=136037 RepID=UPI000B8E74A8|nr:uncharacterized protein LOC110839581 [Zootermopsis nevadensis]